MKSGERSAVELVGYLLAIVAVICLGASAMSMVNVIFDIRGGSTETYVFIAVFALAIAIGLGFLAGYLMSWSDPERRGILKRK